MLHPSSPLISYYPPDFESDPNGKRQAWEAVVKVPFIDGDLLLDTVEQILEKDDGENALLTPSERRRNQRGQQHIYKAPGFDGDLPNGESTPKKPAAKKASGKVKGARKPKGTTASAGAAKKGTRKSKPKATAKR